MKTFKRIILILILLFCFVLVGCGGTGQGGTGQGGGQGESTDKTIEQIKLDVQNALNSYVEANSGSFKLIMTVGGSTTTTDMTFNFEPGKIGVLTMKVVLTTEAGEMSCYVKDGKGYTNRYNEAKDVSNITAKENEKIAEEYSFETFCEYLIVLLNDSYFAYSKVDAKDGDVYKTSLEVSKYAIDNEEESELLTKLFDGVVGKDTVTMDVTYSNDLVSNLKLTLVGESTSTIELQLLGISETMVDIEFPDFSDYK